MVHDILWAIHNFVIYSHLKIIMAKIQDILLIAYIFYKDILTGPSSSGFFLFSFFLLGLLTLTHYPAFVFVFVFFSKTYTIMVHKLFATPVSIKQISAQTQISLFSVAE